MKYTAELITIGSELLKGSVLNTNAQYLGRELTRLGFDVVRQVSCDDIPAEIDEKLGDALVRSSLVILSGGLGPTPDDVTRDAVADHFGVPLTFSKNQFAHIQKYYRKRKKKVPAIVKKEALFPQNATPLLNHLGIALGFYIVYGRKMIVTLPGVPSELRKMFDETVSPLLKSHFRDVDSKAQLVVKITGLSEPEVMRRLKKSFFDEEFNFGIYPDFGEVTLRIQAENNTIIRSLQSKIKRRLRGSIYSFSEQSLAGEVMRLLSRKKKTLAVAESCTGGKLAAEITKNPGASEFFKGSVTAYSNEIKTQWLGISESLIKRNGAASREVAKLLAKNVRTQMKSSYGIGITGIAGPAGGSRRKPVGTVFLALASRKSVKVWEKSFWGDRHQIQMKAMKKALEYLWKEVA